MPEMPPSTERLTAPRALKLSRVTAHVERTLGVGGITLHCGDKALPPGMALLTVRQCLWKQGGDMVLTYSAA